MAFWLILCTLVAHALDGNDRLVLSIQGGPEVQGWFYSVDEHTLVVSGDNRFTSIPLDSIRAVQRNEEPMALEEFQSEVLTILAALEDERADPPPHPHPFVVASLSMLWAGAGHAVLGEWTEVKGYAVAEGVILGAAVYNIYRRSSAGVLISLAALDLLFKGYSAGEAVYLVRARRARLGID